VQGFFGKIPSLGDFVTRDLPREFLDTWDEWLQQSVADSKSALGDAWLDTYLTSPIWRFVLLPGVCGERGWAGIMTPSVDRVGRYFPLTFASSLGDEVQPFQVLDNAVDWFTAAESLALTVLHEDHVDVDTLQSSVKGLDNAVMLGDGSDGPVLEGGEWGLRLSGVTDRNVSSTVCHELVSFQVGSYSIWWTPGSDDLESMGLVSPDLPKPQCFSRFLEGSWGESADMTAPEEELEVIAPTGESA